MDPRPVVRIRLFDRSLHPFLTPSNMRHAEVTNWRRFSPGEGGNMTPKGERKCEIKLSSFIRRSQAPIRHSESCALAGVFLSRERILKEAFDLKGNERHFNGCKSPCCNPKRKMPPLQTLILARDVGFLGRDFTLSPSKMKSRRISEGRAAERASAGMHRGAQIQNRRPMRGC